MFKLLISNLTLQTNLWFLNYIYIVYQTIKNESAEEKKLQQLEERFLGKRKDQTDFL